MIKNKNFYCLDMFPYPSGSGLHVGHPRGYSATDVFSRYKKLQGYNVLHPMGWDAFGLPAENFAIKNKIHPEKVVRENIAKFKKQLKNFGFEYNWDKEINTTDPKYYRWTQYIFLKLYNRGLAYEDEAPINFCPSCKTGLANEEVVNGKCERCGSSIERKKIRQWILKITEYADRLLNDLDELDWPEPIKEMQRNWIGRSEGSNVIFDIKDSDEKIEVFTTRVDTLFGCTWVVIAPEHQLISKLKPMILNYPEVERYIIKSKNKSDLERTELSKEKTGIMLKGVKAINPINNQEISVWISDYVLAHYGTGCVMAVPAHDERDYEFAKKFNLKIIEVIKSKDKKSTIEKSAFTENGILVNSGEFNGLDSEKAKIEITKKLQSLGKGDFQVNYKLRDWIFSRQRYWGEPIPIVHCESCGIVPIPETQLPVVLPYVEQYEPTGDGTSPLANENDPVIKKWLYTKCPKCKQTAKRETNTMPQWAGSCWYYIAYLIKKGNDYFWDKKIIDQWLPVDLYVGGAEHAVLHLLYARFWHKVLFDEGLVGSKEPFQKLINVGTILGIDGQKMSKSRGNVVSPDPLIEKYGSDALKMYELYIGPFSQMAKWDQNGVIGMYRFLEKISNVSYPKLISVNSKNLTPIHKAIKKVGIDIERFSFNTAISTLIETFNIIQKNGLDKESFNLFLTILSPFAPQTTSSIANYNQINIGSWPKYNEKYIKDDQITIPIQINGKVRDQITITSTSKESEIKHLALGSDKVARWIPKSGIKKFIYVKGKIISIVV